MAKISDYLTVGDAPRQLRGLTKPVYVQGADAAATKKALEHYGMRKRQDLSVAA